MRHPLHPIRRPLFPRPLHPRPAVPGPEHFREIVHALEVLALVARLARQQPHVDQGEHEQVAALVIAAVLLPDPLERLLQRGEVAHGRASRLPGGRGRTSTGRDTRGSSSASSSTSSIVSTGLMSSSFFTSSGTSTTSLLLRAGTSTVFTPARTAAVSFSLRPPIGSTRPRSVSSPVIATSWRAGRRHSSDASAAAIVIPAEGPSFGTAPAGTWRCTSV